MLSDVSISLSPNSNFVNPFFLTEEIFPRNYLPRTEQLFSSRSKSKADRRYIYGENESMLKEIAIVFNVVFALEAVVIIIGNVFTIFVFWTRRFRLKRTCFLLINLAIADVLVGIAEFASLLIHRIPRTEMQPGKTQSPSWAFQTFGSCTSVMFLALISLERAYAVLWPLRHRVSNTRAYIYSIVTVWVAGLCIAGLSLLTVYHSAVDSVYATATAILFIFISLLVICASYFSICSRLHRTTPQLQARHERSTERNLRLLKTFYIVVAVSLIFWLPSFSVYAIKEFCWDCFSLTVLSLVNVLQLVNSLVNPLIYSFRMQLFKDALKTFICWRKYRQDLELNTVSRSVGNVLRDEGFTTHL